MLPRADGAWGWITCGVVQHAERCERLVEERIEIVFGETEVEGNGVVQIDAKLVDRVEIGQHGIAEARELWPVVRATEGLSHARVIVGQFEADVEGLLAVDLIGFRVVEVLGALGGPAPVVAGLADVGGGLDLGRKGEEGVGGQEGVVDQGLRDAVARYKKEAGVAAGMAQVPDETVAIFSGSEAGPVENGDHGGGSFQFRKRSILRATRSRCALRLASVELSIR